MSISSQDYLRALWNAKNAVGMPSVNSDATLQIEGFETLLLQTKQFPWPVTGPQGEIEQALPMGVTAVIPQNLKVAQQGNITFTETVTGAVMSFMTNVITRNGGIFNATVYEGTPDRFVRAYRLRGCFFVPEQADRDWENKAQLTLISGTLHFHFFGEEVPGGVAALN